MSTPVQNQKTTSLSSTATTPTPQAVLETFTKLVAQAKTTKVSAWSNRTIQRALGWASLSERSKKWPDGEKPKIIFLSAVVLNPSTTPDLKNFCIEQIDEIAGDRSRSNQVRSEYDENEKYCTKQLPKRLKQAKIDDEEVAKRIAAEHLENCCENNVDLQLKILSRAKAGHAWYLEAIVRIAAVNKKPNHWSSSMVHNLRDEIVSNVGKGILRNCNLDETFGIVLDK
jgi:hypothetical protein